MTRHFAAPEGSLISSCQLDAGPVHDRVRVFIHGALAGTLVVAKGIGEAVVQRLAPDALEEKATPTEPARPLRQCEREGCTAMTENIYCSTWCAYDDA